jgi:putative peptidoglycan lipid II flippase
MIAQYFSNDVRDAFFNAFRLPNLFRRLFGEGALSISFIPVLVGILNGSSPSLATDKEKRARELIGAVFAILLSGTITISLLAIIFMDEILGFILNGHAYHSVPGKFDLTVRLARIMFGFLILISIYALFMAILNSLRKFALTAIAPCFFNVAVIGGAIVYSRLETSENILAWAVLIGGFLQMAVLIPAVAKSGHFPRLNLRWSTPDVARVFKGVLPVVFGMSIMQLTAIVNMRFTSQLPSGSQSYLFLAARILELPLSLFVVSVTTAILPTLSKHFSDGDRPGMTETISHYLRLVLFVALPAAVGMFVLAQPIVEVLFLGRQFKYSDAVATIQVIQIYSFMVLLAAGSRILSQGFYAIQNTWYPALSGAVALFTHVIFAIALTAKFGLPGLAAASVCSGAVNLILLITGYRKWIGTLELRTLMNRLIKFLICAAVMLAVLLTHSYFAALVGGRVYSKAFVLLSIIGVSGFAYMATAHLLRIPEYHETVALFRTKVSAKLSTKAKRSSKS